MTPAPHTFPQLIVLSSRFILPPEPRETKTEAKEENGKAPASVQERDKTSEPPRKKQKLTGQLKQTKKRIVMLKAQAKDYGKVGERTISRQGWGGYAVEGRRDCNFR